MNKTLLDLYLADCPSAKKQSSRGEWAGPCPFCGGTPGKSDRFHVFADGRETQHYWCRSSSCVLHKRGDAIEYLRLVKGMSYKEACAALGIKAKRPPLKSISPAQGAVRLQAQGQEWEPHGWDAPSEQWRRQAARLLDRCIQQLHHYDNAHIRRWLADSRLLNEESIRSAYLGYCPRDLRMDRAKWGLKPEVDDKGQPKPLWIPEGIVIPCYRDGVLHRLRVRRFVKSTQGKKYIFIQGGSAMPYVLRTRANHAMIVESELDAILINQAAGDLVNTVGLGSVSIRPDPELHEHLMQQQSILVALDDDKESRAGMKAAWGWWAEHYDHAYRCPVVGSKDPTDAAKRGLDLRLWIQAALAGGAQRMAR